MFKRIFLFFFTYLAATGYAQTLLFLWFYNHHVSYIGMLVYALCNFATPPLFYLLMEGKMLSSRTSLRCGVFTSAFAVFIASIMTRSWEAFIVGLFFAFTNVFFWTVYNTMYFKFGQKETSGYRSGLYFLLFPFTGAITAPIAGLIADRFGYTVLYGSSFIVYLVPFFLVSILPVFDFQFETKKAFTKLENKFLIFLQGCNSVLGMVFIPTFTLYFIFTPISIGRFFAYLSLLAALAAVFNSKLSDKLKHRGLFFYFFSVLNALSYIPVFFLHSLGVWQVFAGVNEVTSNLANPFDATLVLDHAKLDIGTTMLGREIYLNLGRVAILIIGIGILWFGDSYIYLLLLSAFTTLIYPVAAYYKKVYL